MDKFLIRKYFSVYFIAFVLSALYQSYLLYKGNLYFENSIYSNYGVLVVQNLFLLFLYKKYSAIKETKQNVIIRINEKKYQQVVIKYGLVDIVLFQFFCFLLSIWAAPQGIANLGFSVSVISILTLLFALIEGLFVYFVLKELSQYFLLAGFAINFGFHYLIILSV